MIYISSLDKVVYATTSKVGKGLQISNQYLQSTNAATPSNTIKISYNNVAKNQGYLTWKNSAGNSCRNVMQGSYGKTTMTSTSAKNTTSSTPYSYTTSTGTVTTSSRNIASRTFTATHTEKVTGTASHTVSTKQIFTIKQTETSTRATFFDGGHVYGAEFLGTETRITAELDIYLDKVTRGITLGRTSNVRANFYYTNYWSDSPYFYGSAYGSALPIPRNGDFKLFYGQQSNYKHSGGIGFGGEQGSTLGSMSWGTYVKLTVTAECESFKTGESNIGYKTSTAGTITYMWWTYNKGDLTFSHRGSQNAYTEWWSGTTSTKTTIDSSQKTDTTVKDNWIREYSATATNISSTLYPSKSSSYTSTY